MYPFGQTSNPTSPTADTQNRHEATPDGPPEYKVEALEVLAEWRDSIANDRAVSPTEANATLLREINTAINAIEQIV